MIARICRDSRHCFGGVIKRRRLTDDVPGILLLSAGFSSVGVEGVPCVHLQEHLQQEVVLAPKKFIATPYHYHAQVQVDVVSLSSEGLGVAMDPQHPERSIIVPKVWPGEKVTVKIFRNNKNHSEADLVRVDVPAPERITPRCPHYSACSGCQLQHVPISAQHAWKKQRVISGLLETGCDLSRAEVDEVVATSEEHTFAYRSKITPQMSYHKKTPNHDLTPVDEALPEKFSNRILNIGFAQINSRRVLDIPECLLATRAINERYDSFRRELQATHAQNCRDGTVITKKKKRLLSSRLFRDDLRGSVYSNPNEDLTQVVRGLSFKYKAGEFFQVNPFILPALVTHVVNEAKGDGCTHLIDAYCGSGLFSLSAAEDFQSVFGIEVSHMAVQAAKQNAVANQIHNVEFIEGQVQTLFAAVKNTTQAVTSQTTVIIDPSRKGCDVSFLDQLIEYSPKKIVYVSCNPTTQARDAHVLVSSGYIISRVTPFDMFPQTKHVENVLTFKKI